MIQDALTKIYPRYVRDDMFTFYKKDGKSNIVEKNFANSIDGFMVHSMLTKYSSKVLIILNKPIPGEQQGTMVLQSVSGGEVS